MRRKKSLHTVRYNPNDPVTKGEFDEAMAIIAKSFNGVDATIVHTKNEILHQVDTKIDTAKNEILHQVDTKIDTAKNEILHHFDAAVENIHADLAGANKDEISGIKTTQHDHEHRIVRLEKQSALRP